MAKAMILAAGQGTRVRPLTKDMPKPMVPILGKPVMEYLIEHLARYGIRQIMINVAYYHWKIENYFGNGERWGVEIGYSYEGTREHGDLVPKPWGSAGGMRRIQDHSGFFDESFGFFRIGQRFFRQVHVFRNGVQNFRRLADVTELAFH